MANYVKFVRGLSSIFDKLTTKDANTLYFIYENETSESGRLYLGDKEIVCHSGGSAGIVNYLKDLLDVSLPEDKGELIDGQVLTYDATSDTWVARDVAAVAEVLFDINQFERNEKGEWSLLDFANAPSGSRLTKSADGKLIWDLPSGATNEELAEQIEALNTKFNDYDTAEQVDVKIVEAVAAASHLSYKTVETIDEINLSEDKYIYLVKNGDTYDEYMVINGKLEAIGSLNVDLTDYATKAEMQAVDTKVNNLAIMLNGIPEKVTQIETSLGTISTKVENLEANFSTVGDLAQQLNTINQKIEAYDSTISEQNTKIEEIQNALNDKVDQEDFEEFKASMSWKNLSDIE